MSHDGDTDGSMNEERNGMKPLPSLQHILEIEESFCSTDERMNEMERGL